MSSGKPEPAAYIVYASVSEFVGEGMTSTADPATLPPDDGFAPGDVRDDGAATAARAHQSIHPIDAAQTLYPIDPRANWLQCTVLEARARDVGRGMIARAVILEENGGREWRERTDVENRARVSAPLEQQGLMQHQVVLGRVGLLPIAPRR